MNRLIGFAAAAGAGLLLAGCSIIDGRTPSSPPSMTTGAVGSTEEIVGEAVLANGRHLVYLKTLDLTRREITFDLAEFYTGADAVTQWQRDHPGQTPDPALSDFYIRNLNTKLRTLPIADGAKAHVLDPPGGAETVPVALAEVSGPFVSRPFWMSVFEGKVTLLEEQYLP